MVRLFSLSKKVEELNKDVYKVEIQSECSHDGFFCVFFCSLVTDDIHCLDSLCIVGCERSENHDTDTGYDEIELAISDPDIHDACDDDTDESHEPYTSEATEVIVSHEAVNTHKSKHTCCDKKYISDRGHRIHEKNRRKRNASRETIEEKDKYCSICRHFLDPSSE